MVEHAILLPDDVAQTVAHRHGELSIEAVRDTYSDTEIIEFQRRAAEGDCEVTVLAALDELERERVEDAAAEAGQHPAVWLAETATEAIQERGPVARPETVTEQVESAILRLT